MSAELFSASRDSASAPRRSRSGLTGKAVARLLSFAMLAASAGWTGAKAGPQGAAVEVKQAAVVPQLRAPLPGANVLVVQQPVWPEEQFEQWVFQHEGNA